MELKRVVQGRSSIQGQGREYNSGYKAAGKTPEVFEKTRKLKKMQKCCSGSMPQSVSGTAAGEASANFQGRLFVFRDTARDPFCSWGMVPGLWASPHHG